MSFLQKINGVFHSYEQFVNNLGPHPLMFLAFATMASGISFATFLPIPVFNHLVIITAVATVYYSASHITPIKSEQLRRRHRRRRLSLSRRYNLSTSESSSDPSFQFSPWLSSPLSMIPLKPIPSRLVPAICLCSYLHVLVILAVLRPKEDFGVSDGCLSAAYSILFSMDQSLHMRCFLFLGAVVFTGLKNLQFAPPPPAPSVASASRQTLDSILVDPRNNTASKMNKANKSSQPQASRWNNGSSGLIREN